MHDKDQLEVADFLVIGNKRCGTGWLNANLAAHPEIFMTREKGVHFFDNNIERGLRHYAIYFEGANSTSTKMRGETEHSYFWNDDVPERIKSTLGVVPLVLMIRHPVDRAYSTFKLQLRNSKKSRKEMNFESMFRQSMIHNWNMTAWGFYGNQIRKYLKVFPLEAFHFVEFDDIKAKPKETIQAIYTNLGVESNFEPPYLYKKMGVPATDYPVDTGRLKAHLVLSSMPARALRKSLRRLGLNVAVYNRVSFPPLSPDLRRELTRFYDNDIELFMKLTGQDLQSWLSSE